MSICVTGLCCWKWLWCVVEDDILLLFAKEIKEFVVFLNDEVRDKIIDMRFGGLLDLKAGQLYWVRWCYMIDGYIWSRINEVGNCRWQRNLHQWVCCPFVFGLPNVGAGPPVVVDMKEGAHHSNELWDVVWSVNSNISVTYIKKRFWISLAFSVVVMFT